MVHGGGKWESRGFRDVFTAFDGVVDDARVGSGDDFDLYGAYNVVTGFLFGIPMPLQPMKTIAAVALSEKPLSLNEVIAAGIFVSICVFIAGATGMIDRFNRVTPVATISGMQLGLGFEFGEERLHVGGVYVEFHGELTTMV